MILPISRRGRPHPVRDSFTECVDSRHRMAFGRLTPSVSCGSRRHHVGLTGAAVLRRWWSAPRRFRGHAQQRRRPARVVVHIRSSRTMSWGMHDEPVLCRRPDRGAGLGQDPDVRVHCRHLLQLGWQLSPRSRARALEVPCGDAHPAISHVRLHPTGRSRIPSTSATAPGPRSVGKFITRPLRHQGTATSLRR